MTGQISSDGPGPMILRVDPDNGDVPLGSVLIDFYPERAELSIVATSTEEEATIRGRVDAWAVDRACGLLRERCNAPTGCGGRCGGRGDEQA